jgi:hypothetical protein
VSGPANTANKKEKKEREKKAEAGSQVLEKKEGKRGSVLDVQVYTWGVPCQAVQLVNKDLV